MDDIPIIIVSHNNVVYLKFMIDQIRCKLQNPLILLDNQSKDIDTKKYLTHLESQSNTIVIYQQTNHGPRINRYNHAELYASLPVVFIQTDPDIQFHKDLPKNFIKIMYDISEYYGAEKVGFALDIHEPELLYDIPNYFMGKSLIDWELQFWENPIDSLWDNKYPLYYAEIDTTFCLINKKYQDSKKHIRIGGDFLSKHIPWYKENPVVSKKDIIKMASMQEKDSTMSKHLL